MSLDNLEVKHRAFGSGVIVSTNGKYITVKFDTATKKSAEQIHNTLILNCIRGG